MKTLLKRFSFFGELEARARSEEARREWTEIRARHAECLVCAHPVSMEGRELWPRLKALWAAVVPAGRYQDDAEWSACRIGRGGRRHRDGTTFLRSWHGPS